MKTKKDIDSLYKSENKQDNFKFEEAVRDTRRAIMCYSWICKAIKDSMSDEEIMKVVRKDFMEEALDTDE